MATNQNCTQSANADRQNNTQSITWKTSPLTDKKNFRFKDCKAWNQYRQNNTAQYIRVEVATDYSPSAGLSIPTDPNPWNVLRSVIDQFYQREIDIAWKLLKAQQATENGQKLEEKNRELQEIFWKQDKRIGELKALLEKGNTLVDHSADAGKGKTVSYREFEIEMNAKNKAYFFILSSNLLNEFSIFCREHPASDYFTEARALLLSTPPIDKN